MKDAFYEGLVGLSVARVNAYWSRIRFTGRARPPLSKEDSDEVIDFVSTNADAIGYIRKSEVNDSIKVVFELP